MKKVHPLKLLVNSSFTLHASNCSSIKNEKNFKECYYSFKDEEQLLKDTESFCAGIISGHSLADNDQMSAHSAL